MSARPSQRVRHRPSERVEDPALGSFLEVTGTVLLVGGIVAVFLVHIQHRGFLYEIGAAVFIACGAEILRRGKKLNKPSARAVLARDGRPPVLLLRSFRRDETKMKDSRSGRSGLTDLLLLLDERGTYEEELERIFHRVGPLVALGSPGDTIRPLGAARDYGTEDDWQERFLSFLERARLIVVVLDETPGLRWELREVLSHARRPRTVLLLPDLDAVKSKQPRSEAWNSMWSALRQEFPFLPVISATTTAIAFSGSGKPLRIQAQSHSLADHCKAVDAFVKRAYA